MMYFDVLCMHVKFGIVSESNSRLIVDQQGYRTGRTKTNLDEKLTEVGVIDFQYCPTADQVADIFTITVCNKVDGVNLAKQSGDGQ